MNELIKAAKLLSKNCTDHPNCKGCLFSFSQVCILKWTKPEGWNHSIDKVMERRNSYGKNKL